MVTAQHVQLYLLEETLLGLYVRSLCEMICNCENISTGSFIEA